MSAATDTLRADADRVASLDSFVIEQVDAHAERMGELPPSYNTCQEIARAIRDTADFVDAKGNGSMLIASLAGNGPKWSAYGFDNAPMTCRYVVSEAVTHAMEAEMEEAYNSPLSELDDYDLGEDSFPDTW